MHLRPFDFNIHLPSSSNPATWLESEQTGSVEDYKDAYRAVRNSIISTVSGANFMLFNEFNPDQGELLRGLIEEVRRDIPHALFTQLLDFRREDLTKVLSALKDAGVNAVKFHSYVQQIARPDIEDAVAAARQAEALGLFICIDASYGTVGMYDYDNLLLAVKVLNVVKTVPVVILHSGGARCLDAMLLLLDSQNAYLETSFSLSFYKGSTVESNLAFCYKKAGAGRVLYASDSPYISMDESLRVINEFFDRHEFGMDDRDGILSLNAHRLISGVFLSEQ
jgi:hypothetical protein